MFPALWTACHDRAHTDLPSNTRWPGQNGDACKGLDYAPTLEAVIDALAGTQQHGYVDIARHGKQWFCNNSNKGSKGGKGDTLLEAAMAALAAAIAAQPS